MQVPDVIGYTLGDAKNILKKAGVGIHRVEATSPSRQKGVEIGDDCRVIRCKSTDDGKIELIVCKPL
jgi:hypothetical protein